MMPFALEIAKSRVAIKVLDHARRQIRYFENPQIRKPVGKNESEICVFFGLPSTVYIECRKNISDTQISQCTSAVFSIASFYSEFDLRVRVQPVWFTCSFLHFLCYSLSHTFSNSYSSFIFLSLNFQLRS